MQTVEHTNLVDTIAAVRARRAAGNARPLPKSGWREVAGTVRDDALYREAARLGEEWRQSDRQSR
jgi:hypothetical protein